MFLLVCCLWGSVGILAAAIIAAVLSKKSRNKKLITPIFILAAGAFVSGMLLFVPIYHDMFAGDWIKTTLLSIHNAIRLFVIDCDFEPVRDAADTMPAAVGAAYALLGALLYVFAPLMSFGFFLSLVRNITAYTRLLTARDREYFVFSNLNKKSLALAKNIKNNRRRVLLIFANTSEDDDNNDLYEEAKKIGAVCFGSDIPDIQLHRVEKTEKVVFFAIGQNEADNINDTLNIIERYGHLSNSSVYLFATNTASEMLLASKAKDVKMKIRRVNDVRALVERNFYDNGVKLFENALPDGKGKKIISALVVGAGRYGCEVIRILAWLCQMDGYRVEINVIDSNPLAESKFAALCPELIDKSNNGVYVEGEAQYHIVFHSGIDVNTIEFINEVTSLNRTTYAFVALGDDNKNIDTSATLRMLMERMKIKPYIQTVVYDERLGKALDGACNYSGQPYEINCIGDLTSFYSEHIIIDSELEQLGLERHLNWGSEEEYWSYEYNYRSSIAAAIHMKMRVACGIPGAEKNEKDMTEEEKKVIACIEHRRWNAYMRSEGFVYSGSRDKSSRNNLAKTHHDLVSFSELGDSDIKKDINVGTI